MRILLAVTCLLLHSCANAQTVRYIINNRDDLSMFRDALVSLGLFDILLDDPKMNVTVFAPTNDVLLQDATFQLYTRGQQFNPPTWHDNLEGVMRNHIIANASLTADQVFDKEQLQSLYSELTINTFFRKVEQADIVEANKTATNGYVHIVNSLVAPPFVYDTFSNLEEEEELGPDVLGRTSLVNVVDFVDGRSQYDMIVDRGLTHVGCRIRAFNRINDYQKWTINSVNHSGVIEAEFLNASMVNETIHNFIQYTLVPKNYYYNDMEAGFEERIMPVPNCGHMFVTKHVDKLCFNNACTINTPDLRTFLAANGVGYVVDKCLVCPGVSMLAEYVEEFTQHNLKDVAQMFISSEWNRRNLSLNVGDGGPITLFAAINDGWFEVNSEDVTRLSTDMWKPHQLDLLRHMMVQGNWSYNTLQDKLSSEGPYNLTSLAGQNLTVSFDEEKDLLSIAGGSLFYQDVQGVDGVMHFTDKVPLPFSMTNTVYEIARRLGNYSAQLNLIDSVFLSSDMNRLSPLTAFYAADDQWMNKQIDLTDISTGVLENHIFKELLWCDVLISKEGQQIESHNGRYWLVSVNEENMPCLDTVTADDEKTRSCVTKCDILARNGIVHEVDTIILFEGMTTRGPSPPIPPTFQPPSLPNHSNRRPSAMKPSAFVAGGEFGPVAYSKPKALYDIDELQAEGSGSTAGTALGLLSFLAVAVTGILML
ncbi:hypothetical protein MPSEU_000323900 [Mayamaea pseudoterrestris]|nr:hypothetical protein MPSEU_000323900 [Mayamaea pseudoterrestris]